MSHNIMIEGGTSVRLPTAGKYCDRDIIITATGGTEDLNDVLTEQEALIDELKIVLSGKASGGASIPMQEKTVEIAENGTVEVIPDDGYALSKVTANVSVPIPEGYIQPSGELEITENGSYDVAEKASVLVSIPERVPNLQEKTVTENGEVTPDSGYDGLSKVTVIVTTGGGSNNYAKFTATTDSTTSFIIENPLGGIAKKVSIKAISPTTTSTRKIHLCCVDWDVKIGAIKTVNSSGSAVYSMNGIESTPNNGQFRMTEGFITVYRYNSANTWDTTCEYEIELYQ